MRLVVTPIDPMIGMLPRNVAVVSRGTFDTLVSVYQITNSRAFFVAMVSIQVS